MAMTVLRVWQIASVLGLAACTAAPSVAERDDAVRSAEAPAAATQRGRVIGGEKVRRIVAWPATAAADLGARGRYSDDVRRTLDRSPVPVLAPADPTTDVTATIGAHWYALTVHGDGYLLHTHASAEARVHPHVRVADPTHPMRTAGGFLTRNEEIWSASWIEHGAAYSFEIECDRRTVAWCDDEQAVLDRVEALVYIGGKEAGR